MYYYVVCCTELHPFASNKWHQPKTKKNSNAIKQKKSLTSQRKTTVNVVLMNLLSTHCQKKDRKFFASLVLNAIRVWRKSHVSSLTSVVTETSRILHREKVRCGGGRRHSGYTFVPSGPVTSGITSERHKSRFSSVVCRRNIIQLPAWFCMNVSRINSLISSHFNVNCLFFCISL